MIPNETQNYSVFINCREIVNPSEVIMLKADGNYTLLFFANGKKKMIARSLKYMEPIFTPHHFYRTHQSYLINMDYISWIDSDLDCIQMLNNQVVTIARNRKNSMKEYLITTRNNLFI